MVVRQVEADAPLLWRGDALRDPVTWTVRLAPETARALADDAAGLRRAGYHLQSPQLPIWQCPPPGLPVERILRALRVRGFVVVDGFPVEDHDTDWGLAFWRLGSLIGEPLPQNHHGRRIDVVRDEGTATVRGAKTGRRLDFHTDFANTAPDMFGLLTLRQAREGGDSYLVNGYSAHQDLRRNEPAAAQALTREFFFDRTGDVPDGAAQLVRLPVLRCDDRGLMIHYNRARIHRGHRIAGQPLDPAAIRALDAFDAALWHPSVALRLRLIPGQALFINNAWVLHSRSAFADWPEPERRRTLLRLWLRSRSTEVRNPHAF